MTNGANQRKTLFLIDGYAQLFRAYHAIRSQLASPVTKEPTNATFGFVGMLLKVLREYRPDYLAIVVDVSGDRGTFRSEIYPEYKAHRESPPMDFGPQVERCLSIARSLCIPVLGAEGFEADDVIATLVTRMRAEHPELDVRLVSKDKDLEQLLDERVEMLDVHKDERITVESLRETKGITPGQVVDVLALMGDAVDNVPGVPGIGPKTAAQLIHQYGSIENLLEHVDEIKGKRRENIEATRHLLPMSKELVRLRRDVDVEFDLESARVNPAAIPVDELTQVFRDLGFNRYQEELRQVAGVEPADSVAMARDMAARGTLFADSDVATAAVREEGKRGTYECIKTEAQLKALIRTLEKAEVISIDTETTGLDPLRSRLCGVSVSVEEGTGAYIPTLSPDCGAHLSTETVLNALRPILEDPRRRKVGHNLKFDWIVFKHHGVNLRGIAGDSMVAGYLVDSARPSYGLDAMAKGLLNYQCISITDLIGKKTRGQDQLAFNEVDVDAAAVYAAEDADVALRLTRCLEPQLKAMGLRKLYDEVETPLVEVLASMEYEGIRVDPDILDEQRAALQVRIDELRAEIQHAAPHEFNPDSPKQLAAALFNKPDEDPPGLGLRVVKRGKTGPSTDIEVLEKLAEDPSIETPVPRLIVEYRQLTKLVNTYLVALKESINPDTGRVHASFHQTGAATGRLSSSDPNLQNIPVRTDVGRRIRAAFVAEPGHLLITADYSQIELRLLAHLSRDEGLIEAFRQGEDIHRAVAAQVFGVPIDQVTREQRNSAKMVNFGIVYGITPYGLARRLGESVSAEQARAIIDDYKARYPGIGEFLNKCVRQAQTHGFVETILGRRRAVPQVHSQNVRERALGERVAINSVVQGSAADLIKIAMVRLHGELPERFPEARLLLQIHDELVFEAPESMAEQVRAFVVERMEGAMQLRVPLRVDAAAAPNWLDSK